jgi:ferredoxin
VAVRAEVDEDICISSGKCVADAPGAFEFDDDEIAHATALASELDRDRLVHIGRTCPSGAIRVFDGDDEIELD